MYSMTGYGKGSASGDGREITVELKSVNHRYLDVGMRLPRHLSFLEDGIRSLLTNRLSRGHIDVFVNYRNVRSDARTVEIDVPLLFAFVSAAKKANETLQLADDLTLTSALRLPDISNVREADEDSEAVLALTQTALNIAIDALLGMRLSEGERLKVYLSNCTDTILTLTEKISKRAPIVVSEYKTKLDDRIQTLLGQVEVDRARLATEVALFADKASIDEEITRLHSHITEFRSLLNANEPSGRKLDFVVQEMNREFNTIGSKANDGELTNLVLSGKAEIEKIREQVQNIE
ncbi:MAG TPA: YicC/YloC family endoribonuclease [Feifaniaceae bacterium]|nr:YicC/YloC family endoribonuclease [Feifaniaceae bacterium]